ncbi:hypothetical protein RIF29_18674 [Crotalaria pallida]|uniref:RRM domain-containing protein n=1 Tax=Crotalaria pallida TaxID=3830 RepID=A0AAN9I713_CROPI
MASSSANSCCPRPASDDAVVVRDGSMASFSSSSVSCHDFKECCPCPSRPYPRRPPPPPPRADDDNVSDYGVSDEEDDCFCIPFPWLLEYHRERLGKPDLTETQLCQYFRDNLKRDATDDDFNLEDWDQEWSEEDSVSGKIVESKIIKDKKSGECEGFGFVSFEYEKSMFDAIQLLNGHVLRGHTLTVFKSINRGYPGTKDDEGPHSADAHGSSGDSKL